MLIDGLPDDSRLTTAQIDAARDELRPPAKKGQPMATVRWGQKEHLLADVRDLIAHLEHTIIAVASAQSKGSAPKPPKPLPRPTDPRIASVTKQVAVHKRLLERFAEMFIKPKRSDGDTADEPGLPGVEEGPRPLQ